MRGTAVVDADGIFQIANTSPASGHDVDVAVADIAVMPPIVVQGFKRCGNVLCVNLGVP